jgi:cytochrome c peroxidase
VVVVVTGCWSEPVDHSVSSDQWAKLHDELRPSFVELRCPLPGRAPACKAAAELGQMLFFDTKLSSNATVSCASCHDPTRWFVDTRSDDDVSFGAKVWTRRNSMGLVDIALKDAAAPATAHAVFTWSGAYDHIGAVLELAITKPMDSNAGSAASVVRDTSLYRTKYADAFFTSSSLDTDAVVFANLELAFAQYFEQLRSGPAPFDAYLDDPAAISESAARGFAIFVGKGTCLECHNGPLLGDFAFRNTGVPQIGPTVPETDLGRQEVTNDAVNAGQFLTPSLRNVAKTAPYMHDGALATLTDVVEFYRHGGVGAGYSGARDPRIVALDLSDDDVLDLVAFLEALTGTPVDPKLTVARPPQ